MNLRILILGATAAGTAMFAGLPVSAQTRPATQPTLAQYESFGMTHPGDAARGKTLFLDEKKLACGRCHSLEASEAKVGPSLFAAGDKFGRRDLVESILKPSATVAVGFSTTTVRLRSGGTLQGILRDSTPQAVTLMQSDGKLAHLAPADVAVQRTSDASLMPEGLQNGLTLQEFADLIEYLTSIKLPESAAALGHGMPSTIEELATPVALRPFTTEKFEHPVWFGPVPGQAGTFAVEEHESGKIWFLKHGAGGAADAKSLFADTGRFMPGTRGLVGFVIHPKFADIGKYYYIKQIAESGNKFRSVLFQGEADGTRTQDSGKPPQVVLPIDMTSNVHYGGGLQFGPDGYLYDGVGDTGPQGDPTGNAQNPTRLNGKMLRIDVDHLGADGKLYSIPADNPFVHVDGTRPEIWAMGLRTPWRFSFDPLTGDLWEGEVGQDLYEEVNVIRPGRNYGWNVYEGFEPYSNQYRHMPPEKYDPPVFAYTRKYGASATGGFVYRGNRDSSFYGVYVFGDYVSSRLFGLTQGKRPAQGRTAIGQVPPAHRLNRPG